ncbi:MAG: alpha/beta hydrolase [Armatimonadota bacterium]
MKLLTFALSLASVLILAGAARAEEPQTLQVWPGRPPGETAELEPERDLTKDSDNQVAGRRLIRLGNVSTPTLTLYRPPKEKDTGASVVIAPGGAYHILALDLEGEEVAEWLNGLGVTGIVLKYRVPRRPGQPGDQPPIGPLQDAQRAVSLVRSKAKEWNLDPNRIGMLGFSAGGHLAAAAGTSWDKRAYDAVDDVDKVSCRPDFLVLIYPAYLTNREGTALREDIRVSKETPRTFLAHAADDPVTVFSSIEFFRALKQAGVPADLHVYSTGGHGYGLRKTEEPVTTWPARCEEWMRKAGLLKKN